MVKVVRVTKLFSDKHMQSELKNKLLKRDQIKTIFKEDVDVYDEKGALLLKFRKNVLRKSELADFYDATIHHAITNGTSTRGNTSGFDLSTVPQKLREVNSSVFGYYDRWTGMHKQKMKWGGFTGLTEVRLTQFMKKSPEKFKRTVPLIESINQKYKQLVSDKFEKQNEKAQMTPFKISNTSFTTVTMNTNFQTSIHKDHGDDDEGFGNLAVIERGRYKGGETCLPQYGIGVDVREGDLLFMDVHKWHGNLPIEALRPSSIRMSIVCYLRKNISKRTGGWSDQMAKDHLENVEVMESTCPHGKSRSACPECLQKKPSRNSNFSVCIHGRRLYDCKQCGGGAYCIHGIRKRDCSECGKNKNLSNINPITFKSTGFKELDEAGIYHYPKYIRFCKARNRFVIEGHPKMSIRVVHGTGRKTVNIVSKYRQILESMVQMGGEDEVIEHAVDQLNRLKLKTDKATFTDPLVVFEDSSLRLTRDMLPKHVNFKKADAQHGCKFTYDSRKSKEVKQQLFDASSSSKKLTLKDKYEQMLQKLRDENISTMMRQCAKCHEFKPIMVFSTGKDGVCSWCEACQAESAY